MTIISFKSLESGDKVLIDGINPGEVYIVTVDTIDYDSNEITFKELPFDYSVEDQIVVLPKKFKIKDFTKAAAGA